MSIEDYNRQVVEALEKAQRAAGVKSGAAFARLLARHTGGSPDTSTYNRWLRGEAAVPAWALLLASRESSLSLDALVADDGRLTTLDGWRAQIVEAIGRLEAELIEVRQHLGLPWRSGSDDAAAEEASTDLPASGS